MFHQPSPNSTHDIYRGMKQKRKEEEGKANEDGKCITNKDRQC